MTGRLKPDFVQHASAAAIRVQYEHAEAQVTLWADRARDLFLLLCEREEQEKRAYATADSPGPDTVSIRSSTSRSGDRANQ